MCIGRQINFKMNSLFADYKQTTLSAAIIIIIIGNNHAKPCLFSPLFIVLDG